MLRTDWDRFGLWPLLGFSVAAHLALVFVSLGNGERLNRPALDLRPISVSMLAAENVETVKPETVPTPPRPVAKSQDIVATNRDSASVTQAQPKTAQPMESAPPAAAPQAAKPAPTGPTVSDPRFDADYLKNPAPVYPNLSRRLRETGLVQLRVQVSSTGQPLDVAISKSCGFERLDQAALAAVKRWRFQPAVRGDTPVEAWVLVPVEFSLEKSKS